MSYLFDLVSENEKKLRDLYLQKFVPKSLIQYRKGSIKICEAQTLYSVITDKGYKSIADIGTGPGFSCLYFAKALKDMGISPEDCKIYSYDVGDLKIKNAEENLKNFCLEKFVNFKVQDAAKAIGDDFKEGELDFVLIDGNHKYKSVLRDYEAVKKLVRPGGCIAFDDCFPRPDSNPGPRQVVDALIEEGKNIQFVGDDIFNFFSYKEDGLEAARLHKKWSSARDDFCIKEKSNPKEVLALYFVE